MQFKHNLTYRPRIARQSVRAGGRHSSDSGPNRPGRALCQTRRGTAEDVHRPTSSQSVRQAVLDARLHNWSMPALSLFPRWMSPPSLTRRTRPRAPVPICNSTIFLFYFYFSLPSLVTYRFQACGLDQVGRALLASRPVIEIVRLAVGSPASAVES